MSVTPGSRAARPVDLSAPLRRVVGGASARALEAQLGLRTVEDLLRHYPRRYLELGEMTDLGSLVPGESATIQARVVSARTRSLKNSLYKLDVVVTDGQGQLTATFFRKRHYFDARLKEGADVLLSGKVEAYGSRLGLTNPEIFSADEGDELAGSLRPIYPATAKLASPRIQAAVRVVLDLLGEIADPIPEHVRRHRRLLGLSQALTLIHRPVSMADVQRAKQRLRFEEAFVLQVALAQRRAAQRALPGTPRVPRADGLLAAFDARLPFELTAGQRTVCAELLSDLSGSVPMHRLLHGEVGSGKTVVALRAMLAVVDSGGQAALLAPTEVLAQQHHRSISALLGPLAEAGLLGGAGAGTRVTLITGSQTAAQRRRALLEAATGEAGIVVGTHALLQEAVDFFDLGLIVVDEQHRFGVEQRDVLRSKAGRPPHVLVMTATPIPRTVAMTVFGDLDVSTLTELPGGRSPVATHVVPVADKPHFLARAWQRVREEVAAGRRAYVVCPRIGDDTSDLSSDTAEVNADGGVSRPPLALADVLPLLRDGPLHGLRVEALHGRLQPEAKNDVMSRFAAAPGTSNVIDVLVATTVIEVGVDVADATVMLVMDADRYGVSQLHQLRGRVGRGSVPGLCLLVTEAPAGSPARARLDAVAATMDGFELSRIDLEQRREGDVLGAVQSGRRSSLRLLGVLRDEQLIRDARDVAGRLVANDPELSLHPRLRAAVHALAEEERADYLEKT